MYIAISQRSVQAIDFSFLASYNLRFWQYRPGVHPSSPAEPHTADDADAELIYYCWPAEHQDDPVPAYATSVEGAFGLVLSVDLERVLLVFERPQRSSASANAHRREGAQVVSCSLTACCVRSCAGEQAAGRRLAARSTWASTSSKRWRASCVRRCAAGRDRCGWPPSLLMPIDGLVSVRVQVDVRIDLSGSFPPLYLGGYQQSRARDNLINDNFSTFLVRAETDHFKADFKEIHHAQWIEWRPLLQKWRNAGKPPVCALAHPHG